MRHRTGGHLIVPAVEMADEAHHLRLGRVGARKAQREMRRLRARRREAHALGARDQPLHQLGPAHLELVRGAPMGALRHLLLHRLDHGRMGVAEQQRAVAAEIVDILVAVDVPFARPRGALPRRSDRARACASHASARPGSPCRPPRRASPSPACGRGIRSRSCELVRAAERCRSSTHPRCLRHRIRSRVLRHARRFRLHDPDGKRAPSWPASCIAKRRRLVTHLARGMGEGEIAHAEARIARTDIRGPRFRRRRAGPAEEPFQGDRPERPDAGLDP